MTADMHATDALANELHGTGVHAMALCPGWVHTEFHDRAGIKARQAAPDFMWLDADKLVSDGLADVDRGKILSIPGVQYKIAAGLLRVVPRSVVRKPKLVRRHRPNKD